MVATVEYLIDLPSRAFDFVVERRHIIRVLEASDWVIEGKRAAATRLGLNLSTLRSRMEKLGIAKPDRG